MKKALLIGINYRGTSSELNGCINDVQNLKELIVPNSTEVIVLTDDAADKPTKENILNGLNWLADCKPGDNLLLQYSGHGSYIADVNGDESDHRDEVICPIDYDSAGFISDDTLRSILSKIPADVNLFVVMDCCHSGTILDLKYLYTRDYLGRITLKTQNYQDLNANIISISGCKDTQTSADTFEPDVQTGKWEAQGALTYAITSTIKKYRDQSKLLTWRRLMLGVYDEIKA